MSNYILSKEASDATKWLDIRQNRNALLSQSDWTQVVDSPLTDAQKYAWAEYRQKLRDLPNTVVDVDNVTYPTKPTE